MFNKVVGYVIKLIFQFITEIYILHTLINRYYFPVDLQLSVMDYYFYTCVHVFVCVRSHVFRYHTYVCVYI